MKRIFLSVLLALSVALGSWPARGAPAREARRTDGLSESVRSAAGLFAGAALLRGVTGLEEGGVPDSRLLEGVLLLGLSRGLLPGAEGRTEDGWEIIPAGRADELLQGLFSVPGEIPQTPSCPCIERDGDRYLVDTRTAESETGLGAWIWSVQRAGNRLNIQTDLYTTLDTWQKPATEVYPEYLAWVCSAEMTLEEAPDSPLHWKLTAFQTGPEWLAGETGDWQESGTGAYTVSLPREMAFLSSRDGEDLYEMPSAGASLSVSSRNVTGGDPVAAARASYLSAHPDARIVYAPEGAGCLMESAGETVIIVSAALEDGVPGGTVYTLRAAYPEERQAEFSFYCEMIRNTFWFAGMPNG